MFASWSDEDDDGGMKMFSDCSGPCVVCACTGGCLAGHGDDDFSVAPTEQLRKRLETGRWGGKNDGRALDSEELSTIRAYLDKMK
jgi:hypothetical protein